MGYQISKKVVAIRPKGISDRAYIVLLRMAWTCLDRPQGDRPAGTYFAGWQPLALALGYDVSDEGPRDVAAHQAVARSIRELVGLGIIRQAPVTEQSAHRYAVYVLEIGIY